jgi:hypothetical protein
MPWYRVEISSGDIQGTQAEGLMNRLPAAHRAAGLPAGVRVYHGRSAAGDHIYYFSPEAAAVAVDLLQEFHAAACTGEPDLGRFTPVSL